MTTTLVNPKIADMTAGVWICDDDLFICSCGNVEEMRYKLQSCPSCGTHNITGVSALNSKHKVRVDCNLEVIEKSDKYFHIKKEEVYLHINKDKTSAQLKVGKVYELKWSLKDKYLKLYRNGKEIEDKEKFDQFFQFFRGIDQEQVLSLVSTESNKHLLKFAYKTLGKKQYERKENFLRGLSRLFYYPVLELFNFAGFGHLLNSIWENPDWRDSKKTKPHEILGIPRYMLKFVRKLKDLRSYQLLMWRQYDERFSGNNTKTILEILDDENDVSNFSFMYDYYVDLVERYGYKDHKRLMTYLARDIKLQQGIPNPLEGVRLLRDYVRLCKDMGLEFEKYPKSLKKNHDIALMNYMVKKDKDREEAFKKVVESEDYDSLLYTNKKYTIVKPTSPSDLIDEGDSLNHCVASYVDDVLKKKCKILFIRYKDFPDDSLLTVEIRGDKNNQRIIQAKGQGNRKPNVKEDEFIREWAEKRNLKIVAY